MKKVLSVVVFLLMSIGAWAGEVIIVKNPSNGGTVAASAVTAGQTCTLTVTPTDGFYLKSIKAVTTVDGSAIQAPEFRAGSIDIDESELTITSDASADPSGETTHTFTMPEDANLNVEVTAEFEARHSISDAVITLAETSFTYDGTAKEPAVSKVTLDGVELAANEYSVGWSNNVNVSSSVNPTVTVTGLRSYTGTATTTFTISAKSITSDMITLSPSSFVYCGETQTPGVTVTDGNTELAEETDYTIGYQLVNGATVTDVEETRDVATYNVVVTGQGNYGGSATKSFEITKAQLENLSVSLEGWTYGEQPEEIEPSIVGNLGEGGLTFYFKAEGTDDNTYLEDVPVNAGNYTIKVEVAETANYASGSATADFTIAKAYLTVEGVRELTVSITNWKYGEQANEPSVDGNLGEGEVIYTYKDAEDEQAGFSEDVPTNVGSYIIKATVAESDNYYGGTATNNFSIEKGDIPELTVSTIDGQTYDGEEHALISVSNAPDGTTVKYYYSEIEAADYENGSFQLLCEPDEYSFSATVPTTTNVGYFALLYRVVGGDNYNNKEAGQLIKVAVLPAEITEVTVNPTSMAYTGEAQTVTITSVKAGDLTLGANDYTVTLNDEPVEGNITAKDVDEYTVTVTGKGNFTGSKSATFSIVNRTLAEGEVEFHENWATYYSADGDVMLPENKNIGAYVATGVGDGVVTVSQISYIPEGVAVLLNNATETVASEAFDVQNGVNLLQHAAGDVVVSEVNGTIYGLYNGTMMRVTGTIPAGKNYLLVVDPQEASQLTIVIDGEGDVTSVNSVRTKIAEAEGGLYDLTGRKIQKLSNKGLYIQNGRKVVVK